MPTPDIYSLFASPDDATSEEQARALSAALRKQHDLGTLAVLSGDPILGKLGASELDDAGAQQHLLATAGGSRLTKLLQQKREDREKGYQDQELALSKRRVDIDAGRAAQESWVPVQTGGGLMEINRKTGQSRAIVDGSGAAVASKGGGPGGLSEKAANDEFLKFGDSISSTRGRSSLLPKYQQMIDRAGRIRALAQLPDGSVINATPQQVRELSTALAAMINGGNGAGAVSQIEELTPQTLAGQWANVKQKFLNEPTGADAQAFIKQMLESAGREENQARDALRSGQVKSVAAFANLRKRDKTRFDAMLKAEGIDPATIDDNGLPIQAAASSSGLGPPPAGTAWVQAPTGKIKAIPLDQVQAAITVGGGKAVQ